MQRRRTWTSIKPVLLAVLIALAGPVAVLAQTSSSNNYQVTETQFNSTLNAESCSGQYCATASIGDMSNPESSSPEVTAKFGPVTSEEPVLEVIVDPGESNLGVLSTEKTATKTTVIRIRNHLSEGYVLQIIGDPPKYGGHTLKTPNNPTAAVAGVEQFALNAAANTSPSVGSGAAQVPSNQTSFGVVNDDYRTANMFKYVSGDVIAHSLTQSGQTNYTISMIVNISNATPAGHYSGDFSAVVVPYY